MVDSLDRLFRDALDRTEAPTSELGPDEVASALSKISNRSAPKFRFVWAVYAYEDGTLVYLGEVDPGPVLTYLAKRQVSVPTNIKDARGVWAYVQGVVRGH